MGSLDCGVDVFYRSIVLKGIQCHKGSGREVCSIVVKGADDSTEHDSGMKV